VKQFLMQMAGESGSGKSTLALAAGKATGAVPLDKDRITGPLIEEGVLQLDSGPGGFFTLAESFLAQGFSVVLDSACFWQSVLDRGRSLARRFEVDYRVIECSCPDEQEQDGRLAGRARFDGQPASRAELAASLSRPGVMLAIPERHLSVGTTRPLGQCLEEVLEYLRT
jgi:predicted kinase